MKRFYKEVGIEQRESGWQVMLDARPIRSQGGSPQIVPTGALAELLAGEWREQGEEIDLRSFIFRDLADYAIDMVRRDRTGHVAKLLSFAQTDTLCYRADPDDAIFKRQQALWEPIVTACEERHQTRFERVSGIIHRPQNPAALSSLRARLEQEDDFTLSGLVTLSSLAASIIVPLAVLEEDADIGKLFAAANCEEDWQAELWGWDAEAEATRKTRQEAFEHTAAFLRAARD